MRKNKLDDILSVAASLISEKGYERASFQEIATRVGLQKSSLFHYLNNKEELLIRIFERSIGEVIADLKKIANSKKLSPEEQLKRAVENHITSFLRSRDDAVIWLNELGSLSKKNQTRFLKMRKEYERTFEKIVVALQGKGHFTGLDKKIVLFGILGMLNWVPRWYKNEGRMSPSQISDIFSSMIIDKCREKVEHTDA
jgi:AcrR family transcriptional regulator